MNNPEAFLKNGAMLAAAIVMSGLFLWQQAAAQSSNSSPAGSYALLCGDDPIPRDAPTIPWIGCFYLSAGHSATGTFANQKVEVAVDAAGHEVFKVNGTVQSGRRICPDTAPDNCPSGIDVQSRNADKSVLFTVSECFPPRNREHVCVMTQKAWDFEKSGQGSEAREIVRNRFLKNPNVPMPPGPLCVLARRHSRTRFANVAF